jgi:hypothetical protein
VFNYLGKGDGRVMYFAEGFILGMILIAAVIWFSDAK